jgi:hypothetical protein
MAGEALAAALICPEDRLVHPCIVPLNPGKERGAEVEADLGIVINDLYNPFLRIQDTGSRVRGVALLRDPLVPIVEGIGRILELDLLQPWIFPGRLVEVTVYAYISVHKHHVMLLYVLTITQCMDGG